MSKGILGALEKAGFVESDIPEVPHTEAAVAPAPVAPPSYSYTAPPAALSADDQERLKALEAQVYATPSTYVIFQKLRTTRSGDGAAAIFAILEIANPGVTPAKVLADIETHLGVVAAKRQEFDRQIAQANDERVVRPGQQVAQMQTQLVDLQTKIAQLQPQIQAALQSIQEGSARFKAVEDQLTAPLLQAKQLVTPLA